MRDNYDFSDSTPNLYTKMKTSPALPDEVTQETMQSTDIKTKNKTVVLALQELIKKNLQR
jgi:Arc/MetJ family transcription regulator